MARKYVMANNDDGNSDIIIDEAVEISQVVDLWINYETPANLSNKSDPSKGPLLHEPPDGGAIFRLCTFSNEINAMSAEAAYDMHMRLKSLHVPSLEYLHAAKHPTMHKTDTLNYFVLLQGRLWALSEGRDVLMEPGDFIIQMGCMHGWRVEGDEPALLAAILIDAQAA